MGPRFKRARYIRYIPDTSAADMARNFVWKMQGANTGLLGADIRAVVGSTIRIGINVFYNHKQRAI